MNGTSWGDELWDYINIILSVMRMRMIQVLEKIQT